MAFQPVLMSKECGDGAFTLNPPPQSKKRTRVCFFGGDEDWIGLFAGLFRWHLQIP